MEATRAIEFRTDEEIQVTIAPNAGACFGVVRAIKLARQALKDTGKKPVYSLGPLIHNPSVVGELADNGVKTISDPEEAKNGTVILRSHGVPLDKEEPLLRQGNVVVDATCPLVKKPQKIAKSLGAKGYFLIVVGDENHPEIKGVLSYFKNNNFLVTYSAEKIDSIPDEFKKVGILAQTTIEAAVFNAVVDRAKARFREVLVYNTICDATTIRQNEAVILAQQADVMIVVGGKDSSNTSKLVKLCKQYQPDTYHVERFSEIQPEWLNQKRKIGVTGGASTPQEYVDLVGSQIVNLLQTCL